MAFHMKEKRNMYIQGTFIFVSAAESVDQEATDEAKSPETSETSEEQAEEPMDEN